MDQDWKRPLGIDVLEAARERVSWTFDTFSRVYLSGPSGKDSGAMMHIVCQEARRRGRRIGALFVDLEAQYSMTIEHVEEMLETYADVVDPYWLAVPIQLRNATSNVEPKWMAWDPRRVSDWVRRPSPRSITDSASLPWYREPWQRGDDLVAMEFEEAIEDFAHWYSDGQATACFVGIRVGESLNRWRAIVRAKHEMDGRPYTCWKGRSVFNVYPIYDWTTEDVWTFFGRTGLAYNRLYDQMHLAGLSIHQMRICQPYGDDQRQGLHLFHVIEPKTWSRIVNRVSGANMGALYSRTRGNVLGNHTVELPDGHTWQSYAEFLLDTMPREESEHYRDKIAVFIHWWRERKGVEMMDCADPDLEARREVPTWRRVVKTLLKNDRGCKGLSFGPQRSTRSAYEAYKRVMKKRRERWQIYPT